MNIHSNASKVWSYAESSAAVDLAMRLREYGNSGLTSKDIGSRPKNKRAAFFHWTERLCRVPEGKTEAKGPMERKVWNVSAVLQDAGLDGVPGFNLSGGKNYQHELVEIVAIALRIPVKDFLTKVNAGRQRRTDKAIRLDDLMAAVEDAQKAA